MIRTKRAVIFCAGLLLLARVPAAGQVTPIEFSVEEGGVFSVVTGSAVTLQAPAVGQPVSARMRVRNTSVTDIRVDQLSVSGGRFTLTGVPGLPVVLPGGQFVEVGVTYNAISSARTNAQIAVAFTDAEGARSAFQPLIGTAPEFRLAYVTTELNTLPLANGGTVTFPPTQVNNISALTMIIENVGTGTGRVNLVSVTGAAFRLQGLPLFPAALDAGQELRFSVRFTPAVGGPSTGTLRVALPGGDVTIGLEGVATASSFAYELLLPESTQPFTPGSTVTLPETPLGSAISTAIRVANTGTGDGLITNVSVVGTSFQLSEVPTLPVSVPAQNSIVFVLTFTPRETGRATGRLRIGNDIFEIVGIGTGPRLLLSYRLGDTTVAVPPTGNALFPPTQVGDSSTIEFLLENKGNRPASIANVSLTQTGTSFSLTGVPLLPLQLEPDQSLTFALRFSPPALGQFSAGLRINSDTVSITGSATQPPPIPGYSFTGPSGNVEQMQQPAVGLTLDAPYPLALRGTLTLGFESETFADDPSLQFSIGGRTVSFTIEPGSRQALFSNGATNIRFQTGTVGGTIILTPSFSTADVNLTPAAPTVLRLSIAPAAPRLLNLQIGALSSTAVTFLLSAASNTRTLQSIEIVFNLNPAANVVVRETRLIIDIGALAETYYRSAASAPFGGTIQVSAPVSITSPAAGAPSLLEIFDSATITLINSVGRSNSMTIPLR